MSTAPLTSPNYPRGLAKVGYSLTIPQDFYVTETRYGFMTSLDGFGQISGEGADENGYFDNYFDAVWAAQAFAEQIAEEERDAADAAEDCCGRCRQRCGPLRSRSSLRSGSWRLWLRALLQRWQRVRLRR